MYELNYSRHREAYILVTDGAEWSGDLDGDIVPLCIIQADSEAEALRTAQSIAKGPVEVAR